MNVNEIINSLNQIEASEHIVVSEQGAPLADAIANIIAKSDGETKSYICRKGAMSEWLLRDLLLNATTEQINEILEERFSLNIDKKQLKLKYK